MTESAIEVVAAIIWNDCCDKILIARRAKHKHQGGLWEFPGGKVEALESQEQALRRELMEELNIEVGQVRFLESVYYQYPAKTIHLNVYQTQQIIGQIQANEGQDWQLVAIEDLANFNFPDANQAIINKLINGQISWEI